MDPKARFVLFRWSSMSRPFRVPRIVLLGFHGFYWVCTGLYQASPIMPGFYLVLLGFTVFHWVLLGLHWVILSFA